MKKFFFFSLTMLLLAANTGCSNDSVSKSKADSAQTTKGIAKAESETMEETTAIQPLPAQKIDQTITIQSPTEGSSYITASAWNVIRGTTPAETHHIEVNGYQLQKYIAGSQDWNYIAATRMQTLIPGENTYVIKAFNLEGKQIAEQNYKITYTDGQLLPSVGNNLSLIFSFSLLLVGTYFFFRRRNFQS